ncbi:hypothetical protein [Corallococcus carmarthensis]|uniref:Lipoprotein n=1 Tax=Corallococcus carmarthensis TaxID=2316728 RepID=A0A3A8K951_9BACT|nr:hypothetical protein [Corallococcus carmarthensis]NOK17425.1 hypothetical protein [Corallococcus carmarthensis]RKH04683.1 hypothetical protein D7X32_10305 [Corallococcus carmarthensis]
MKRTGWGFVLGTGCALMIAACGAGPEEEFDDAEGTESVKMSISLAGDACGVTAAAATVSAPDLPPSSPQSLYVGNGYIEGYLSNIPVGSRRVVDVRAYNRAGLEVYAGSAAVDVYQGSVAYAQLQLKRNPQNCPGTGTGDIYIIGTLEGTGPGPSYDAGTAYDAGPGPSFDAGAAFDAG